MEGDILHASDPRYRDHYIKRSLASLRLAEREWASYERSHARLAAIIKDIWSTKAEQRAHCQHKRSRVVTTEDDIFDDVLIDGERTRVCMDCERVLEMNV